MEQLPLNLEFRQAVGRDDFIISACNEMAAGLVEAWPEWSGQIRAINVAGAALSGKSHLGAVWQAVSNAERLTHLDANVLEQSISGTHFVLDGVAPGASWDEELLFLLLTRIKDADGSVMLVSREPVSQMDWQLADLRSRLRAVTLVDIADPDDGLMAMLLEKYFADRQLAVPDAVLHYIVARMERSFTAISLVVDAIDKQALASKKQVSLGLAREVLARQTGPK